MSFFSCDMNGNVPSWTDLRLAPAPVFTIWITGTLSAAFPILLAYRSSVTRVPRALFEYAFPLPDVISFSHKLAQVRQISRFWFHHRHSIYTPPRSRYWRAHLTVSWSRMEYSSTHSIFSPITPILICCRNVALPPDVHFHNVLHYLCFGNPCFSRWHSQAHEAWNSVWYVDHHFGLLPFPTNSPSSPLLYCLGTNSLPSPT